MKVLNVIPARRWVSKDGRTASLYGAVPWTGVSGNAESDWKVETVGWTWENDNGTIGLGRPPAATKEEAEEVARRINARGRS